MSRTGRVFFHERYGGVIRSRISVPGVQPKLSLYLDWSENRGGRIRLAPAYDLVATQTLLPGDEVETALAIHGRKANLSER